MANAKVEKVSLIKIMVAVNIMFNFAVDWAQGEPNSINLSIEKEEILTPVPGPAPKLNNPSVFGSRPGNPFIYRIPATGKRPMSFSAESLPESLSLNPVSGIITGNSPKVRGEYLMVLKVRNSDGQDQKAFKLIVGDRLALTPPMGWNSWYIHSSSVSETDIRQAADVMIASGMADYGYMYVNIDDGWSKKEGDEPYRNYCGNILPNEKFPDMEGLTEYIHSKGLRAGIYTSPGPLTCGKYVGSYQHEQIDAQQFAKWGFDFLKYDWCSYRHRAIDETVYEYRKPYALMGQILQNLNRDIVFNLCQYGMSNVWEWGDEVGGQSWRTERDLSAKNFMRTGLRNSFHAKHAGPGHWNDPDYILIGWVGHRPAREIGPPTPPVLSPNQRYQHMSMWSLMAAPLFFSGDLTRLDDFTLNVLCNAEVIAVNQDELGHQAVVVTSRDDYFVMVKPLADGSTAAGLFNRTGAELVVKVFWSELGIRGQQLVRDLWRQQDIGNHEDYIEIKLPRRGVAMLRLTALNRL